MTDGSTVDDGAEYAGPAELAAEGAVFSVQVRLAGRFEPVDGRFHWGGRISADPEVARLVRDGQRQAVLTIGTDAAAVRLGEVDPWGGVRVQAVGRPPWMQDSAA